MRSRVRLLKTRVPHYGRHAGIQRFVDYLDPNAFETRLVYASDSDADLPLPTKRLRQMVRQHVQKRGMPWYKLSDLWAELRSFPACACNMIDILHYVDGEHGAQYLPAFLKRLRRYKVKTLASYHQPPILLDGLINRDIIANLDHVNLVSSSQVPYFLQFLPPDRISVVLHGIDTEVFRPVHRPAERTVFRCVSAGFWLRDWSAIRAVANKLAGETDIEFHVIANWPTGLESAENVVMHSRISDEALISIYQQCDVLLLPLTDATANNSILEAIACGLPVISSDIEAVREYLPGEEAFRILRNSVDDLADAILHLKRNPDVRARMAEQARRRAEELAWPKVARQYEQLYASLLRANNGVRN